MRLFKDFLIFFTEQDQARTKNTVPTSMVRNNGLAFIEIKEGAWKNYPIRNHSHEELQIGFVERGSSTITCKTLEFKMKAEQAILIPPGIIHLCQPDDMSKFKFTILYITPHWFEDVFKLDVSKLKPQTTQLDQQVVGNKDLFLASFKSESDPLIMESMAIMFLGNFIFSCFDMQPLKMPSTQRQTELAQVKNYMDHNFGELIQLDDLAKISGMTKFSLLRKFKSRYKLSPHAYLINQRINHAKQLLLQGKTVAMTAVTCGFFDQSHFVKTFRQYVGIAPIDYK